MDSNGRPLGSQDPLAASSVSLNNGRTIQGSVSSPPDTSSITTIITTTLNTATTQDGMLYLYLGLPIATAFILAIVTSLTIAVFVLTKCFLKRRREKPPAACIEVSSPQMQEIKTRDAKLFDKIVTEDKVVYLRTAEGLKQFPDLCSEPIYEVVDIGMEFKYPAGHYMDTPIYEEITIN